ncbi:MAG TPA: glycosyltransferase family 9 protein [Steroidobacteraceae bacterium]|nr:glycosyltransferase family 9 protein [Steroidobacteraceae bacterium]
MSKAAASHPVVIWFGRIGDMIMLSALLEILHRRFGQPCRIIGAGSWTAEIYRSHPDVAEVICLGRHTAFFLDREWWRALRALRADRGAPVYVCEDFPRKLPRSRRLLQLSGTPASRCVFMHEMLAAAERRGQAPEHWVDRLVALGRCTPPAFREAEFPWPEPAPRCAPQLEITPAERAECETWLAAQGWLGRPLVLVQPGNQRMMRSGTRPRISPDDHKAWPVGRWAALLRDVEQHLRLRMPQAVILLVGAPQEEAFLDLIRAEAKLPAINIAVLPLRRLFALCAASHDMISVDTGPAHAAAAVGLPLVVLFGAYPPRVWQPRSAVGSPVIGVGGPPVANRLDEIPEPAVFDAWCGLLVRLQAGPVQSDRAAG